MSNQHLTSFALALGLLIAASPSIVAQDHDKDHSHAEGSSAKEFTGDPYLLDIDPATGAKLSSVDKLVVVEHEGRELRFNSEESARAFRSDPVKLLAKVDEALVRQQLPFYPLETCPVSGEKLGGMGEVVDVVYRNRLVRLCCKGCKAKLLKDPVTFIAKLDGAVVAAQRPNYPLTTCVVSGEELGGEMGEVIDLVVGNRLVRLCCEPCIKGVRKDPLSYLAKLDKARAQGGHEHGDDGHDHNGKH